MSQQTTPSLSPVQLWRDHCDVLVPVAIAMVTFAAAMLVFPLPPLLRDSLAYTMTALRLVHDHFFAYSGSTPGTALIPNANVTPGPPIFLALFYLFAPGGATDPVGAILRIQPVVAFAQYLLSVSVVAMLALIGRSLGGKKLALTCGIAGALYLPLAWSATVPLAENLGTALFTLLILVSVVWCDPDARRPLWGAFAIGVLTAAVTMVRPSLVAWIAAPLVYLAVRRIESWKRLAMIAVLGVIGYSLVFAPWWIRSERVAGHFVALRTDDTALSEYKPANPPAPFKDSAPVPTYPDALVRLVFGQGTGGSTFTAQLTRSLTGVWVPQLADVGEELFTPGIQRVGFAQPATYSPAALAVMVTLAQYYQWLLLAAAILGVAFVWRSWRLLLVLWAPVYVIAAHSSVQVSLRYVFPAMPALIVLGACGAFAAFNLVRAKVAPAGATAASPATTAGTKRPKRRAR